jgi:hypothetical protein
MYRRPRIVMASVDPARPTAMTASADPLVAQMLQAMSAVTMPLPLPQSRRAVVYAQALAYVYHPASVPAALMHPSLGLDAPVESHAMPPKS